MDDIISIASIALALGATVLIGLIGNFWAIVSTFSLFIQWAKTENTFKIQISLTCLRCLSHVKSFTVSLVAQIAHHRALSWSSENSGTVHGTTARRKSGYFTVSDGCSPAEHFHNFGSSSYYRSSHRRNDFAASASARRARARIRIYVLCLAVSDIVVLVTMALRTVSTLSTNGLILSWKSGFGREPEGGIESEKFPPFFGILTHLSTPPPIKNFAEKLGKSTYTEKVVIKVR